MLSVILPASNEASYIGPCLKALLASDPVPGGAEVIVVANGCRDDTSEQARKFANVAAQAGWGFTVVELAQGGKPLALNHGDRLAKGACRVYLDADVIVSAGLLAELAAALSDDAPCYASGRAEIPAAKSAVTRAYARFWQRLPFAQSEAPGFGLFAVNAAGRARWAEFPGIISDDTFVRLQFAPHERLQCKATYSWPMIEGFSALVRVRKRQDRGVAEIATLYPNLMAREGKTRLGIAGVLRGAMSDPLGFMAYAAVSLTVRLRSDGGVWDRGR